MAVVSVVGSAGPVLTTGFAVAVSSSHDTVVAGLTLPTLSTARTARECSPSRAGAGTVALYGEVQVTGAAPSMEQVKRLRSVAALENVTATGFSLVGLTGRDTVGASGAVRSTVQFQVAGLLVFCPVSKALTENEWAPPFNPVYVIGLVQDRAGVPSNEQVFVAPALAFVQANVADVLFVTDGGFCVSVGAAVGGAAQAGAASPTTSPTTKATMATRRELTVLPIPQGIVPHRSFGSGYLHLEESTCRLWSPLDAASSSWS